MLLKRALSLLLCAAFALGLCAALPRTARAAAATVNVGDVRNTSVELQELAGTTPKLQYRLDGDGSSWWDYTDSITLHGTRDNYPAFSITVLSGTHNITLDGVTLTSTQPMSIATGAAAVVTLADGTTNTFTATGAGKAGLRVPATIAADGTRSATAALTIRGGGSLRVQGSQTELQSGPYDQSCAYGAGIGGDAKVGYTGGGDYIVGEACGIVTIGGQATVQAYGGGPAAPISIRAITGTGIGGGSAAGCGKSNHNSGGYGGIVTINDNARVEAYGGSVENSSDTWSVVTGAGIGSGAGDNGFDSHRMDHAAKWGEVYINSGMVTACGGNAEMSQGAPAYTGAGVGGGGTGGSACYAGSLVEIWGGTLTATGGSATLASGDSGKTACSGCGIGSGGVRIGVQESGGSIVIHAGTVTATGGACGAAAGVNAPVQAWGGAGIGGSFMYGGSLSISILGGTVNATGAGARGGGKVYAGAGIGTGIEYPYEDQGNLTIEITGGDITATGGAAATTNHSMLATGAGIGGSAGATFAADASISISGGTIHAAAGIPVDGDTTAEERRGAGIGAGGQFATNHYHDYNFKAPNIYISGGNILAEGYESSMLTACGGSIGAAPGMESNVVKAYAGGPDVYLTTLTLDGAADRSELYGLDSTPGAYTYGRNDVYTLGDKLYVYLPVDTVTRSATTSYLDTAQHLTHYYPRYDEGGDVKTVSAFGSFTARTLYNATPITDATLNTSPEGEPYRLWVSGVLPAGATVSYQWQRQAAASTDWTDISGANAFEYFPDQAGDKLRVVVTGTGAYSGWVIRESGTVYEPPVITTDAILPGGVAGAPYSLQLAASGVEPIAWVSSDGALPSGLTVDSSGLLSGTPTQMGDFSFSVEARNRFGVSTKQFSLSVTAAPVAPAITTTTLPGGTVGTAYDQTLAATGTAPITWSVASGTLPTGLTLNATTGALTGTPTAAGTFDFTIKATNTAGEATKQLSLTVAAATVAPTITTTTLPGGTVGTAYSQTLAATGTAPITWSVTSGTLPTGLALNRATGALTGTPTAAGTFDFTIKAANTAGSATQALRIAVVAAPVPPVPPVPGASGFPMAGGGGYTGNTYQGSFVVNESGALVCTVQADCKKCTSVSLDGVQLAIGKDCTVECGSTIVTIRPSYLATLKNGAHTLRVQFTDGRYDGTFTTPLSAMLTTMAVPDVPATDGPAGGASVGALVLLLAGLALALRRRYA